MELSSRKKAILQAVVDAYIETAEPVGSRTVSKLYEMGLSSATIRNEMADLEELGYLDQPHSSAGRIPSDLGYRVYVDALMQRYKLTLSEMHRINGFLKSTVREFDTAISGVSRMLSELTQYTTVALTPRVNRDHIKKIDIIGIDERSFIVLLVTGTGVVKNKAFTTKESVSDEALVMLSRILNDHLANKSIDTVMLAQIQMLAEKSRDKGEVLRFVLNFVTEIVNDLLGVDVYLGGVKNIFNYPEFFDLRKAKDFIDLLDNKEEVIKAFDDGEEKPKKSVLKVTIGNENKIGRLKEASIIHADYKLGDRVLGRIGLIGPTRMNYAKTISEFDYFLKTVNRLISQMNNTKERDDGG